MNMSANTSDTEDLKDFEIFNIGDTINVVAYSVMAVGMSHNSIQPYYKTHIMYKPHSFHSWDDSQ